MKELIKKFIPDFLLGFYHYSLALISAFLYGFPSRKMTIIGVTGTSGKSTVVELTAKILEEAGFKTASLSSIKFKVRDKEWENKLKMTMPGRMKLQRFLRQAVKVGCEYAVLEVTSEGIKQFRHKFIDFDVAVLTNLSPEHIEAHGGFEKYREAKAKLFQQTKKIHIINADDKNAEYFLKIPAKQIYGFGIKNHELRIKNINIIGAKKINLKENSSSFIIHNSLFIIPLIGRFNIYNALAAISVALSQGISLEVCQRALEKVKGISGRMEVVIKKPFTVVVDYAHTPEALEKVYKTIVKNNKRMICVLGACGGGRDKWKRPVLGKIAAQYCQEIIVTNEDPYDEDPMEIIEQVAGDTNAKKILDRKQAIKQALKLARPCDTVIITGKGSEPWMCVKGGKKIPWSDRQIVLDFLRKLTKMGL